MYLEDCLEANRKYLQTTKPEVIGHHPQKHVAVITCMDTRLVGMLEPALGIGRGDVVEIKNAGNGVAAGHADVLRSLVGAVYQLGVKEIMVVGHTECGMAKLNTAALAGKMRAAGVSEATLGAIDLAQWIGTFDSEEENVRQTVERIRQSPYLPPHLPVHGLMLDIRTGEATVLTSGYTREGQGVR